MLDLTLLRSEQGELCHQIISLQPHLRVDGVGERVRQLGGVVEYSAVVNESHVDPDDAIVQPDLWRIDRDASFAGDSANRYLGHSTQKGQRRGDCRR